MPLDLRAQRLLAMLAAGPGVDHSRVTAAERRRSFAALMRMAARPPAIETVETTVVGGGGALPARIYGPLGDPRRTLPGLVYFHGGGLVAGDLDTHDALCRWLADGAGCRVVSVGYRLAPEHPFPAAVEDACAATVDVLERAAVFGLDPIRIAVGGDSAGATLATVVSRAIRHRPGPRLACQLLLCPVLDVEARTPSRLAFGEGHLLDAALMRRDLVDYAPGMTDFDDPRLSPLRAADLADMPPALIHTAEFDPLRDEGSAYSDLLRGAGVAVQLRCHAGMVHHFYGLTGFIPAAVAPLTEISQELGRALRADPGREKLRRT
jgi:acetyl esterase